MTRTTRLILTGAFAAGIACSPQAGAVSSPTLPPIAAVPTSGPGGGGEGLTALGEMSGPVVMAQPKFVPPTISNFEAEAKEDGATVRFTWEWTGPRYGFAQIKVYRDENLSWPETKSGYGGVLEYTTGRRAREGKFYARIRPGYRVEGRIVHGDWSEVKTYILSGRVFIPPPPEPERDSPSSGTTSSRDCSLSASQSGNTVTVTATMHRPYEGLRWSAQVRRPGNSGLSNNKSCSGSSLICSFSLDGDPRYKVRLDILPSVRIKSGRCSIQGG